MLYSAECATLHGLLVFMHIPKCAGSSFFEYIDKDHRQWYPPTIEVNGKKHRNSFHAPGCGLKWYGATHCSFEELDSCLASQSPNFVTIVRHPVERVVSEYYWWRTKRTHAWTPEMHTESTLIDWILSNQTISHNRMLKAFATVGWRPPLNTTNECNSFNASSHHGIWVKHYGTGDTVRGFEDRINTDTDLLLNAIHNLETRFVFVAIQEEMKKSVTLMEQLCGWTTHGSLTKKHSSKKPQVSQAAIDAIKRRNRGDMLLYDYLFKRFNGIV